jgi:hypothetical protein
MARKVILSFLIIVFFAGQPVISVSAETNAGRQAAIDGKSSNSAAYQAILDAIRKQYPTYSEDTVVSYVFWAYNDLRNYFSNISIYQVLTGIFEFSRLMQRKDMSGSVEGPRKLEKIISLYLVMKEEDAMKAISQGKETKK